MDPLEMLGLTPHAGMLAAAGGVAAALLLAALRVVRGAREQPRGLDLDGRR